MLRPLEQWFCDSCGGIINGAENGWLEWICDDVDGSEGHLRHGWRIIHNQASSPRTDTEYGCEKYSHEPRRGGLPLARISQIWEANRV